MRHHHGGVTCGHLSGIQRLPISLHHNSGNTAGALGPIFPPPPLVMSFPVPLTLRSHVDAALGFHSPRRRRRCFVTAELMFPGRWWVSDTQERWSPLVTGWVMSATTELRDPGCRGSAGVSLDAVCSHVSTQDCLCCLSVMCVGVQKYVVSFGTGAALTGTGIPQTVWDVGAALVSQAASNLKGRSKSHPFLDWNALYWVVSVTEVK